MFLCLLSLASVSHSIPWNPELYYHSPTSFCSSRTHCSSLKITQYCQFQATPHFQPPPIFGSITFHKEVAVEQIICLFAASLKPSQKGFKDYFKNISYIISPRFISADGQDMTFSQKQDNYIPVFTEQCRVILYFFVLMSKITSKP